MVKHASGADADVWLDFALDRVTLAVSNGRGPTGDGTSPLVASGAGYGLQGIKERVLLVGGRVDAGPASDGWKVEAEVPA
ncbi:MAG: ATP-binding protein [Acidimicrobiales bacterium]